MIFSRSRSRARRMMFVLAVGMATSWMLLNAASADAGTIIQYSSTGAAGSWTTLVGTPTSGGVTIMSATVTSNTPGTPEFAYLVSSTLSLSAGAGGGKVYLVFGVDGFAKPSTPPDIFHSIAFGGSLTTGSFTIDLTSYVNDPNILGAGTLNAGLSGNPATASVTDSGTAKSYNSATVSNWITTLNDPFSINQYMVVTLGSNTVVGVNATTTLATPEPASITILCIGLAGMGGYRLRQRLLRKRTDDATPAIS